MRYSFVTAPRSPVIGPTPRILGFSGAFWGPEARGACTSSRWFKIVLRTLHDCGQEKTQRRFLYLSFDASHCFNFSKKSLRFISPRFSNYKQGKIHGAIPVPTRPRHRSLGTLHIHKRQSTPLSRILQLSSTSFVQPSLFLHLFRQIIRKTSSVEAVPSRD